jgi:hypothetical protein
MQWRCFATRKEKKKSFVYFFHAVFCFASFIDVYIMYKVSGTVVRFQGSTRASHLRSSDDQ